MPQTNAVVDTCRVHRFDPGDIGEIVSSRVWCRCGAQHDETKTAHACTGCGFTIFLPVQGGHR